MSLEHDPNAGNCDTHLWLIIRARPGQLREFDYPNVTHHLPPDFLIIRQRKEGMNEGKKGKMDRGKEERKFT